MRKLTDAADFSSGSIDRENCQHLLFEKKNQKTNFLKGDLSDKLKGELIDNLKNFAANKLKEEFATNLKEGLNTNNMRPSAEEREIAEKEIEGLNTNKVRGSSVEGRELTEKQVEELNANIRGFSVEGRELTENEFEGLNTNNMRGSSADGRELTEKEVEALNVNRGSSTEGGELIEKEVIVEGRELAEKQVEELNTNMRGSMAEGRELTEEVEGLNTTIIRGSSGKGKELTENFTSKIQKTFTTNVHHQETGNLNAVNKIDLPGSSESVPMHQSGNLPIFNLLLQSVSPDTSSKQTTNQTQNTNEPAHPLSSSVGNVQPDCPSDVKSIFKINTEESLELKGISFCNKLLKPDDQILCVEINKNDTEDEEHRYTYHNSQSYTPGLAIVEHLNACDPFEKSKYEAVDFSNQQSHTIGTPAVHNISLPLSSSNNHVSLFESSVGASIYKSYELNRAPNEMNQTGDDLSSLSEHRREVQCCQVNKAADSQTTEENQTNGLSDVSEYRREVQSPQLDNTCLQAITTNQADANYLDTSRRQAQYSQVDTTGPKPTKENQAVHCLSTSRYKRKAHHPQTKDTACLQQVHINPADNSYLDTLRYGKEEQHLHADGLQSFTANQMDDNCLGASGCRREDEIAQTDEACSQAMNEANDVLSSDTSGQVKEEITQINEQPIIQEEVSTTFQWLLVSPVTKVVAEKMLSFI